MNAGIQKIEIAEVLALLGHVNADIGKRHHAITFFEQAISMAQDIVDKGDDVEGQQAAARDALVKILKTRDTCLASTSLESDVESEAASRRTSLTDEASDG